MATTKSFTAAGDFELGKADPGYGGRWAIQISAISGQTVTPQLTVDGTTYVNRAVTPADNSADVATMTTTGIWILDPLASAARLHITGAGSCTISVEASVG